MKTGVAYFLIAPSTEVVCLVADMQKQVLSEPGAIQEAKTWSSGIFFQCVKAGVVYYWMAPSIGVLSSIE